MMQQAALISDGRVPVLEGKIKRVSPFGRTLGQCFNVRFAHTMRMREYDAMSEHVRTLCFAYVANDPVNMRDPTGEAGLLGFAFGFTANVVQQVVFEGKSFGEVDLISATADGIVGATGFGAIKQLGNLNKAVKGARASRKKGEAAGRHLRSRQNRGKDTRFAESKAKQAANEYADDVLDSVEAVSKLGGAVVFKEVVDEVGVEITVNDVVGAMQEVVSKIDNDMDNIIDDMRGQKRRPLEVNISRGCGDTNDCRE